MVSHLGGGLVANSANVATCHSQVPVASIQGGIVLLFNMTQTAVQHIIPLKMNSSRVNLSQQLKGYMLKAFQALEGSPGQ